MSTSLRDRPPPGVADATGPLLQRRRRSRRRTALRIGLAVLVLALVGAGGWLVGFSTVLAAEKVKVTGTAQVSATSVTRTAAVPLGTPLARLDPADIAARVQTLAPVKSVEVDRSWPHTVQITVTERVPAYVVAAGGSSTLVDDQGVAFATVSTQPKDLLRADVALSDPVVLRDVATVVSSLPASVRVKVDRIEATSAESIRLQLDGNREVVWGSADQSVVKAQVLTALITKKAAVYDVSGPANPTTRG